MMRRSCLKMLNSRSVDLVLMEIEIILDSVQILYDEEIVFDIGTAVRQHKKHFNLLAWNSFKLFSQYSDAETLSLTFSGGNGNQSIVLLDDIVISVKKLNKSSL